MKAIKAVFFDIDGTLVSFETHKIPQSTIDAITLAKSRGVKVFIATGRPVAIINNIDVIAHLVDGYITFNGAYCFVGDEDISVTPIPKADVQAMVADATQRNYALLVCGKREVAMHNYKPIFTEIFVEGLGVSNVDLDKSATDLLDAPVLQLTPFFTAEDEAKIMPEMPHSVSARWHLAFTDITIEGADKGNALRKVADYLGLDIAECAAFGDGGNDLTILKAAGVGIAMGNAVDEVKAVADYVTTSVDEDGIKNAMEHLGII